VIISSFSTYFLLGDVNLKKIILILIFISAILIPKIVYAEEIDLAPSATSAIIIEASTGEIIWQKNAHEKLAPASMTKMMSMLLIMEALDKGNITWDEEVTASSYASSMGGSQIFLEAGEKMSVTDLVKGIAIGSGNDATVAMAERIAGTEDNFVRMMNDKAKELELKNTNFKNATGLDASDHYSSAYDMALVARELVKHEDILKFTGTYEDYIRQDTNNSFWLVNTNRLVRFYTGVDGLKTGFTNEAGYCLTATAKKDNLRLITVVMNEPTSALRSSETSSMLDYGFNMYMIDQILTTDKVLDKIKVELGKDEEVDIVAVEEVNILNNKNENKRDVTYEIEKYTVKAPVKIGDVVGKINVIENNKVINTVDMTVTKDVDKASIFIVFIRNILNVIEGNLIF